MKPLSRGYYELLRSDVWQGVTQLNLSGLFRGSNPFGPTLKRALIEDFRKWPRLFTPSMKLLDLADVAGAARKLPPVQMCEAEEG